MTAVLSQFAKQENIKLKLQLMIVPSLDFRPELSSEPLRSETKKLYPSVTEFAQAPWGPSSRLTWFLNNWVGTEQGTLQTRGRCTWAFF